MRWITGIKLNNYRAFGSSYAPIIIPANHHLLIYGENGSGKSSIYNATKDFFNSSEISTKIFELNLFSKLAGNTSGNIEIKISDLDSHKNVTAENPFVFGEPDSLSTHRVPAIKLPNKVKGFLDYKRILETYFLNDESGGNPNLFYLIVEDLLSDHLINRTGGGVATFLLGEEWKRIYEPIYNYDRRYRSHRNAVIELPLFEVILRQLLTVVFTDFRRFMTTYFDPKLDIDVVLSNMTFDYSTWEIKKELFLEIKYAGVRITSYDTFLNEARLSAIGVCIYLAALKTYPPGATDLKVLYLDDVFIGLDTNNRIPLLRLLKSEFITNDFQIFISTYDRQWFEIARNWFDTEKCSFKCLELFVNDNDGNPTTSDAPIVIDPSDSLFESAIKHFEAKDFPAAANYLRKTCEAELKRILPRHLILKINFNTDEIEIHKLERLIDNFFVFLTKNNLNAIPFRHFKTYKKIILNPLSHDDLEAPHYRTEIQDGINLVKELQKIKAKEIVFAKESLTKPLKLGMRDVGTGSMHIYEIVVLENLQIVKQDVAPMQLSVVECEVKEASLRKFATIQLAFDQLWIERGYTAPTNNSAFHNHIKVSTNRHLIDLMTF
jgi:hypothetical protein